MIGEQLPGAMAHDIGIAEGKGEEIPGLAKVAADEIGEVGWHGW